MLNQPDSSPPATERGVVLRREIIHIHQSKRKQSQREEMDRIIVREGRRRIENTGKGFERTQP
ncbi:hypothetical protein AAMO2058_001585700 [Amorphochlora amoebiformis]